MSRQKIVQKLTEKAIKKENQNTETEPLVNIEEKDPLGLKNMKRSV